MSTLVKTYQFASSEGWAYTVSGDGSGAWQSSGGNSGGCWAVNCYGRSNLESGYLELLTTWEALGIPVNSTVNEIDASSIDWLCDVYNVGVGYTIGALEVRDSGGTLQATLKSSQAGSGTTSYASYSSASPVSIPASIQPSDSSIRLRLNLVIESGKNNSAEVNLLIDNISATVDYSAAAIELVVNDLTHSNTVDLIGLTQVHELQVNDLIHSSTLESISITQEHNLNAPDLVHSNTLEGIEVEITTTLEVSDLVHASTLDDVILSQVHNLTVSDLIHTNEIESISITQAHQININDLSHYSTLDSVSVTQSHNIAVNDIEHSNELESVTTTQEHLLTVDNLHHSNTLDSISSSSEIYLIVNNLMHENTIDSISLSQVHNLDVNNLIHQSIVDSIQLSQTHQLSVNNLIHVNTLESIYTAPEIIPMIAPMIAAKSTRTIIDRPKPRMRDIHAKTNRLGRMRIGNSLSRL